MIFKIRLKGIVGALSLINLLLEKMNLNFDQNKKKPPKIKETHFAAVTLSFVCCSFLVNTYSRFIKLHIYKNFQFKPHL